jgi:hypothetical protein
MKTGERANATGKRTPTIVLLTVALLVGFALRVTYLTADRFHADEALYAGWALLIRDHDPLLVSVPVDKPPLYLYTLAGSMLAFGPSEVAARLPSLAASMLSIALVYRLGRQLYDPVTGTWAALTAALSPFDILFSRTAFTDSMLVLWMLSALCAVAAGRWFGAGIALGLAFATKQHAVLLPLLVMAVGLVQSLQAQGRGRLGSAGARACPERAQACLGPSPLGRRRGRQRAQSGRAFGERTMSQGMKRLLAMGLGFVLPFGLVVAWDSARWAVHPGYWTQSAMSYGGLSWAPFSEWGERALEWLGWARYLTGSPVLGAVLLLGCALLLLQGWRRQPGARQTWLDTLLVAYVLVYLAVHVVLQFSIWDRYLLPLAPLIALLLARIAVWTSAWRPSPTTMRGTKAPAQKAAGHPTGPALSAPKSAWAQVPWGGEGRAGSVTQHEQPTRQRRDAPPPLRRMLFIRALRVCVVSLLCLSALFSGWKAAHNGYPLGGEHWAYQGLDQVVAYLKDNAPSDAVLYHHWLRWHYTYYLYGTEFELRWWQSGEHLRREALRTPERAQYIVLPDWRTLEPEAEGIRFQPVYETRRPDGSVSLRVYRVEPLQLASWDDPTEGASE